MAHIYDFKIGTTLGGMTNLEELTVPVLPPSYKFAPASQYLDLGDGTVRAGGWATAEWIWGANSNDYILTTMRDQLRTFCPGGSASVYIQTYTNDSADALHSFQCVMVWPQEEKRDAKVRRDFILKFRSMVQVA